jgi:DNA-binding transcriptional LysR family regulator
MIATVVRQSATARLFQVWNWLPTFLVVAHTEHLPTASKQLHVSVSAISRTIHLLEESLGRALFRRHGRALALNAYGRQWRDALDVSMQRLTSELGRLIAPRGMQELHVATVAPSGASPIVAALRALQAREPALIAHVHACAPDDAWRRFADGALTAVFFGDGDAPAGVAVERLGTFGNGVYCGRAHPLFAAESPSLAAIVDHRFVATHADPWPPAWTRQVQLYVSDEETALQLCLDGQLLAVLPDEVARAHVARAALRRLPVGELPSSPLCAAWSSDAPVALVAALGATLRAQCEQTGLPPSGTTHCVPGSTQAVPLKQQG